MTKKVNPLLLLILATGLPIALGLVFPEEVEPLTTLVLLGLLGLVFVAALVVAIDRENYKAAKTGGVLFALIVVLGLANTEYFKSSVVLEAGLKDDLFGMRLYLRENGRFEMVALTLYSQESFKGKYKIEDDRIIFLDPPSDNDFIADTITIWQDKLVLAFDADGQPDLSFGRYFQIHKNTIHPPAAHGAKAPEKGGWITFSPISERDRINWQQYEADLDTAERAAIVQKLKKHFAYIFESEYYGGSPFEQTVHPMDLDGDGRLDAIVEGYSGGESKNAQVFLERNGAYEKVLAKYQYVKAIETENGRLKTLTNSDPEDGLDQGSGLTGNSLPYPVICYNQKINFSV
jgi:hypothetical protein